MDPRSGRRSAGTRGTRSARSRGRDTRDSRSSRDTRRGSRRDSSPASVRSHGSRGSRKSRGSHDSRHSGHSHHSHHADDGQLESKTTSEAEKGGWHTQGRKRRSKDSKGRRRRHEYIVEAHPEIPGLEAKFHVKIEEVEKKEMITVKVTSPKTGKTMEKKRQIKVKKEMRVYHMQDTYFPSDPKTGYVAQLAEMCHEFVELKDASGKRYQMEPNAIYQQLKPKIWEFVRADWQVRTRLYDLPREETTEEWNARVRSEEEIEVPLKSQEILVDIIQNHAMTEIRRRINRRHLESRLQDGFTISSRAKSDEKKEIRESGGKSKVDQFNQALSYALEQEQAVRYLLADGPPLMAGFLIIRCVDAGLIDHLIDFIEDDFSDCETEEEMKMKKAHVNKIMSLILGLGRDRSTSTHDYTVGHLVAYRKRHSGWKKQHLLSLCRILCFLREQGMPLDRRDKANERWHKESINFYGDATELEAPVRAWISQDVCATMSPKALRSDIIELPSELKPGFAVRNPVLRLDFMGRELAFLSPEEISKQLEKELERQKMASESKQVDDPRRLKVSDKPGAIAKIMNKKLDLWHLEPGCFLRIAYGPSGIPAVGNAVLTFDGKKVTEMPITLEMRNERIGMIEKLAATYALREMRPLVEKDVVSCVPFKFGQPAQSRVELFLARYGWIRKLNETMSTPILQEMLMEKHTADFDSLVLGTANENAALDDRVNHYCRIFRLNGNGDLAELIEDMEFDEAERKITERLAPVTFREYQCMIESEIQNARSTDCFYAFQLIIQRITMILANMVESEDYLEGVIQKYIFRALDLKSETMIQMILGLIFRLEALARQVILEPTEFNPEYAEGLQKTMRRLIQQVMTSARSGGKDGMRMHLTPVEEAYRILTGEAPKHVVIKKVTVDDLANMIGGLNVETPDLEAMDESLASQLVKMETLAQEPIEQFLQKAIGKMMDSFMGFSYDSGADVAERMAPLLKKHFKKPLTYYFNWGKIYDAEYEMDNVDPSFAEKPALAARMLDIICEEITGDTWSDFKMTPPTAAMMSELSAVGLEIPSAVTSTPTPAPIPTIDTSVSDGDEVATAVMVQSPQGQPSKAIDVADAPDMVDDLAALAPAVPTPPSSVTSSPKKKKVYPRLNPQAAAWSSPRAHRIPGGGGPNPVAAWTSGAVPMMQMAPMMPVVPLKPDWHLLPIEDGHGVHFVDMNTGRSEMVEMKYLPIGPDGSKILCYCSDRIGQAVPVDVAQKQMEKIEQMKSGMATAMATAAAESAMIPSHVPVTPARSTRTVDSQKGRRRRKRSKRGSGKNKNKNKGH